MYRTVMADGTQATAARAARRRRGPGQDAGALDTPGAAATDLFKLSCLVQGVYARIAEGHDLTPVQARLVCTLADRPRGLTELARCFEVEKPALTGLVDRAERRGLVQRSPVPGDRRALRVTPTETGRRAAAAFHADVNAELSRLLAPLSPHDREHFRKMIGQILDAVDGGLGSSTGEVVT
jgi:DNA-binding MarR family transcriptional regulator